MVYLSFNITSDRYTSTAKYVNTLSAKGEKKGQLASRIKVSTKRLLGIIAFAVKSIASPLKRKLYFGNSPNKAFLYMLMHFCVEEI